MSDTYDEQIEAVLDGNLERFIAALGPDANEEEMEGIRIDHQSGTTVFSAAWCTPGSKSSLFARLPGCQRCASQVDTWSEEHLSREEIGFRDLFHRTGPIRLTAPGHDGAPTREILNEFARRQRLCRAEKSDA